MRSYSQHFVITYKRKGGFSGGVVIKNPPANAGDAGLMPGSVRFPGVTPVFLLGKFHGQGSLVGYSPWGCKRVGH